MNGRVMDEVHRICRALLQGMDDIEAMQFLNDPEPDSIGVNPETYLMKIAVPTLARMADLHEKSKDVSSH